MSRKNPTSKAAEASASLAAALRPTRCRLAGSHAACSRDARGYTMQTLIVSAILLVAAVAASVVLYRAIDTGAASYSAADVSGTDAPTQPHNFQVEPYLGTNAAGASAAAVKITWAPPLYTGQPLAAGSAALLNYEARYHCLDSRGDASPDLTPDGPGLTRDLLAPEIELIGGSDDSLLGSDFATNESFVSGNCVLRVRAYTCPAVSAANRCGTGNSRTGSEIYGPSADHPFTLSKAPSTPRLIDLAAPDDNGTPKLLAAWDNPSYTGIGGREALSYMVAWEQTDDPDDEDVGPDNPTAVDTSCTFSNIHTFDLPDGTDLNMNSYRITITPMSLHFAQRTTARSQAASSMPPGTFDCPAEDETHHGEALMASTPRAALGGAAATNPPAEPKKFAITPDQLVYTDQNRWETGTPPELLRYKISWEHDTAAQSYLLEWARADGTEPPQTRTFKDPAATKTQTHLEFSSPGAYNFTLWAQNQAGRSDPYRACADILFNSSLPKVTATTYGTEIVLTVSNPSQQTYCSDSSHFPCLKTDAELTPIPAGQQVCGRTTSSYYISYAPTSATCKASQTIFAVCNTTSAANIRCLYNPWSFAFAAAPERVGDTSKLPLSGLGVQYLAPATSMTIDSLAANTDYTFTVFPRHNTDPCTNVTFDYIDPALNPPDETTKVIIKTSSLDGLGLPTVLQVRTGSALATTAVANLSIPTWTAATSTWEFQWDAPSDATGLESYQVKLRIKDSSDMFEEHSFSLPANQSDNHLIDAIPEAPLECDLHKQANGKLINSCQLKVSAGSVNTFAKSIDVTVRAVYEHGFSATQLATGTDRSFS